VPDDDQGNWIMKIVLAALAAFVVMGTTAAPAATIEGQATIVDGDTVKVNGIPVRLKGVDAPEMGDRYGAEATRGMQAIVGSWLRCELTGEKTHNREVGHCVNGKGEDIGEAIIVQGFALACPRYSDRYVEFEQRDTIARLPRATYCLQGTRKVAVAPPAALLPPGPPRSRGRCVIKGNNNREGVRIYHMPAQMAYQLTQIDPRKGERWFCSEADAIAAGWRKAQR
jgi:hypothetical protein